MMNQPDAFALYRFRSAIPNPMKQIPFTQKESFLASKNPQYPAIYLLIPNRFRLKHLDHNILLIQTGLD
jgi:hypothetical protein